MAEHGDRQGAMTTALRLLDQNPKFVPAMKLKAMLLEESGQGTEAGTTYEEALKLAPNDPDLLLKTGAYKLTTGDKEQALKLLEHCVKLTPADGDANFYLAQAYHLNGDDKSALSAIRQSVRAEPGNPTFLQKYGELLCGTGDCGAALRWLLKAQKADATLPHIDYDIAAASYKQMDLAGAAQSAARAVQADPSDAGALRLLSTIDLKLAHWQDAATGFQKLLASNPGDIDSLMGLGQCQIELKDYEAAITTLNSVLHVDPRRILAHFYLSKAYAALGKTAESEHEAALHQLMMEQLTFVRSEANEEHESEIKPQTERLLAGNREEDAIRLYQAHFKGTSYSLADGYVFIGKVYLFGGKEQDGVRCLEHALKIQPTVRGAHTYKGILALKNGDLARAESEFQAELANDPSYQLAIAELGEVRYHQQRWSEAADQLSKSRTITPELLYMLCDSYFHLGKVQEADLNAEAMAAYSRNKPAVMQGLIELLNRNGQSQLADKLR